jgi:hypothetical protein
LQCFVRFRLDRLDPLGFTQEFESESKIPRRPYSEAFGLIILGIICGAETISNAFEELAATMVPLHVSNRSWVLDTLRRDFDHIFKKIFGGVGCEERKYPFRKPWEYNSEIEFS